MLRLTCRDGGVEAVIDHEGGFMASREVADVYATEEPQAAFHARVAFCLDIHNEVHNDAGWSWVRTSEIDITKILLAQHRVCECVRCFKIASSACSPHLRRSRDNSCFR